MRIIAGDYKGRKLATPLDEQIRPTGEKVKEAIFSMLSLYIEDSIFVDLFAGTGGMGLEALSRGAKRCYFCDNSRISLGLVKENVRHCKAEEKALILAGDAERVLSQIREKVDIVFLDPPFQKGLVEKCFETISGLDLIAEDGILVVEHGPGEPLSEVMAGFSKIKEKKYGKVLVSIYAKRQVVK